MSPLFTSGNSVAYVSLGSNLGDRAGNLLLGVRGIVNSGFMVSRMSAIYETEPVDQLDQPPFLNMVAELRSVNFPAPEQIMARLLRVEYNLGRTREILKGPRTIDLDLLLCGAERRESEFLTLPHPRMHLRRFVLEPLAEICPKLVHPTLNETISDLLRNLTDTSDVRRWKPK